MLVAVGSVFVLPTWIDDTSAIAAAVLQLLTLPISASLLARATYRARGIHHRVDLDELADAERHWGVLGSMWASAAAKRRPSSGR